MSCAYELAEEASAGLHELEIWLAEEVLDELERIVAQPPAGGRPAIGGFVHDIVRDRIGNRHYVFLTLVWDVDQEMLHVSSIGHYVRQQI